MKLTNKYDEICGCAYVNIFTITKNTDIIGLSHFDPKNKKCSASWRQSIFIFTSEHTTLARDFSYYRTNPAHLRLD